VRNQERAAFLYSASDIAVLATDEVDTHPYIRVLGPDPLCDETSTFVFVKEWSDGLPLLTWRQKRGSQLRLADILDLADTVGEAIAALHRRGFAHGSLVPDAIVMQEMGLPVVPGEDPQTVWVPKVVDVGLARLLAAPGTWPNGMNALWCAPEAFAPTPNMDWRRVDQTALAALLYALLTDQVPFDAIAPGTPPESAREARRKQIEALPPARGNARARSLGFTAAMSAACMRALSADPNDRYPSLDAFTAALRSAARDANRRGADQPDNTSPGSAVTSKFRALTQPPPSNTGEAKLAESDAGQPRIQRNDRSNEPATDPAAHALPKKDVVTSQASEFDPNNSSPGPRSNLDAMLQKGRQRGAKLNPLAPPVDDASLPDAAEALVPGSATPKPAERAAERLDEALANATQRPAPSAKTKILPAEDEIPDERQHRVEDEDRRDITSPLTDEDAIALQRASGGDWKLNKLGLVLLVLWLATAAYAVLQPAGNPRPASSGKGAPTGFKAGDTTH